MALKNKIPIHYINNTVSPVILILPSLTISPRIEAHLITVLPIETRNMAKNKDDSSFSIEKAQ
jgi:hypothetical protein